MNHPISIPTLCHACVLAPTAALVSATAWGQPSPATAPAPTVSHFEVGLVLDGAFSSRERALGQRERGFGLGHNELSRA